MNITISDDGSVCIKNNSYQGYYDQDGNLKVVFGSLNAPKKIAINYPKKEIGELTYKVSVDTSDLNKLEEQLTRIKQLMQDVETKPKSTPQFAGKLFIKDTFVNSAGLKDVAISYKLEQDTKAELADLRMRTNSQDIAITELKRVMETQHQAWSQAVSELNNRTWCSQK
ncbi:hypothetical protein I4569_09895 [Proteus mirabilis]|nr:hypothetical protein [Proteus mirabilis]